MPSLSNEFVQMLTEQCKLYFFINFLSLFFYIKYLYYSFFFFFFLNFFMINYFHNSFKGAYEFNNSDVYYTSNRVGEWVHYAVVQDNSNIRFYVNGAMKYSQN